MVAVCHTKGLRPTDTVSRLPGGPPAISASRSSREASASMANRTVIGGIASVQCFGHRYVDLLHLIEVPDGWKIVAGTPHGRGPRAGQLPGELDGTVRRSSSVTVVAGPTWRVPVGVNPRRR